MGENPGYHSPVDSRCLLILAIVNIDAPQHRVQCGAGGALNSPVVAAYFIVGMTNSGSRTPVGQRAVTVFCRV